PEHAAHFRSVAEWYQIGAAMGNFTCGSGFRRGSYSRSNENIEGQRFMVVESDTLSKDEVGAIFLICGGGCGTTCIALSIRRESRCMGGLMRRGVRCWRIG